MHTTVDSKGFTLVEMVIVLFIVGILVAIVLGTGRNAVYNSRVTAARADLHLIADALDRYYLRFGNYPPPETKTGVASNNKGNDGGASIEKIPSILPLSFHRKTLDGNEDFYFSNLLPPGFTGMDPWGRPYVYAWTEQDPGIELPVYTLRSLGPDPSSTKEGMNDNIEYP